MKRFNLFQFVFAVVCGSHINGVQSKRSWDPNGICKGPPYDDQSPVVKFIPGLDTCGDRYTTLRVPKYKSIKGDSLKKCQQFCQSDTKCDYAEYNKNNKRCLFAGKENFGSDAKHIVTGYGECPPIGKCPHVDTDYYRGSSLDAEFNIYSPQKCQRYCRSKYGSKAVINYGFYHKKCVCKEDSGFLIDPDREWISGPTRCPHCFGYKYDLSKLPNVYKGSLKKDTVKACQKSCKDNELCLWFQYNSWTEECLHKNPLTVRMNEDNVAVISRDCDRKVRPPYDDQSPVVKIIPGLGTCGDRDASLRVPKYGSTKGGSLKKCQKFCESEEECAYAEYNKNTNRCLFAGKESFGSDAKDIVTGYGECPPIGKCPYIGTDYGGGSSRDAEFDIYSPQECQRHCRSKFGSNAVINYGVYHKKCVCKKRVVQSLFGISYYRTWVSGPTRCPHCYGYKTDLSNLPNVYNGSPNPFLKKDTVEACQKSCKGNKRCEWFEFNPRTEECRHKNPETAKMNKCNAAFASRDCNGIGACNCDLYGSKGKRGECPCWLDSYAGRCHQRILSTEIKSNGQCCFKRYYYNLQKKDCENCECVGRGSTSSLCHGDKGGQCPCRNGYLGRRCDDVKEREVTIGSLKTSFGRKIKALVIKCNGNCEIRGLRVTNTNVNVDMDAKTGRFVIQSIGWTFHGDDICLGISQSTTEETCSYSGILSQNYFHMLFRSFNDFSGAKFKFKIPNYDRSYEQTSYY